MSYGREGDRYYVNSGTGMSRDRVDEHFEVLAACDGSVPWMWIEKETGGAGLVGKVSIRRDFETLGSSRRTAHTLMKQLDPPALRGVLTYTWPSSVRALVAEHRAHVGLGRLQRAGKAAAHLSTDPTSGSIIW
ncbi:MAG: hypothetical protein ACREXS_17105 [Gammaproteobacteria bacterium]